MTNTCGGAGHRSHTCTRADAGKHLRGRIGAANVCALSTHKQECTGKQSPHKYVHKLYIEADGDHCGAGMLFGCSAMQ